MFLVRPHLMSYDNVLNVIERRNASMVCVFYGDPVLDIRWKKVTGNAETILTVYNTIIHSNSTVVIVRSEATVMTVSRIDNGIYTCTANNSYGSQSQNVSIFVQCMYISSLITGLYNTIQ